MGRVSWAGHWWFAAWLPRAPYREVWLWVGDWQRGTGRVALEILAGVSLTMLSRLRWDFELGLCAIVGPVSVVRSIDDLLHAAGLIRSGEYQVELDSNADDPEVVFLDT